MSDLDLELPYDDGYDRKDNTWHWVNDGQGRRYVMLIADGGHHFEIGKHDIDVDGKVTPSVLGMLAPDHGYRWHHFITLLDYKKNGGRPKPADKMFQEVNPNG